METSMVEIDCAQEMNSIPPLPPRSPLRQLQLRDNNPMSLDDTEAYQDAHLESIDRTINEVQSLWPLLHAASTSLGNLGDNCLPPARLASPDDASSIYSFYPEEDASNENLDNASPPVALASPDDASSLYSNHSEEYSNDDIDNQTPSFTTPSFTASSRTSSSASFVATPESESPPPSSPSAKSAFHHQVTMSTAPEFSFSESTLTTDDLFDLIAQIPLVDNMRSSTQTEMTREAKGNAAECYFYNHLSTHPAVRPLLERNNSSSNRISRTFSIRSSVISSTETQNKRSSLLLMPKRMSSLRFPSMKKRQPS